MSIYNINNYILTVNRSIMNLVLIGLKGIKPLYVSTKTCYNKYIYLASNDCNIIDSKY